MGNAEIQEASGVAREYIRRVGERGDLGGQIRIFSLSDATKQLTFLTYSSCGHMMHYLMLKRKLHKMGSYDTS